MKTTTKNNASKTRRRRSKTRAMSLPPVEIYTPERKAEFLLSNSIDLEDYREACDLVRSMGLDPAKIRHFKPKGA